MAKPSARGVNATGFAAEGLACLRGERLVFAGLECALAPGEALLLIGRNGSGKSSLLRLMAGLGRPQAGSLLWNGEPISLDPDAHRARLAYVGHADAIKTALSVRENLIQWAQLYGTGEVEEALGAMELIPLADLPARVLSAGQRRRLALARLFLRRAPLWLLDEPTLGLDAAGQATLAAALAWHLEQRGFIVMATHAALPLPHAKSLDVSRFGAGGRLAA